MEIHNANVGLRCPKGPGTVRHLGGGGAGRDGEVGHADVAPRGPSQSGGGWGADTGDTHGTGNFESDIR